MLKILKILTGLLGGNGEPLPVPRHQENEACNEVRGRCTQARYGTVGFSSTLRLAQGFAAVGLAGASSTV